MAGRTEISRIISQKIGYLESEINPARGNALLANLRRGVGKVPGEIPEILGSILEDLPEEYLSESGYPTREEWTVYTSLTLYALHQQGWSISVNTKEKTSVGKALAILAGRDGDINALERSYTRFKILASAKDIRELSYYLRGIIQLLRSKGIMLNYEILAGDLYDFQDEEKRSRLLLRWGQDLYRSDKITESEKKEIPENV